MTLILGVETSCDETAVAVVRDGRDVLSNVVASQIARHAAYGGVIPELAAREHLNAIRPVTDSALKEAAVTLDDLDAIAVTNGPGLAPALMIGANFARGLAAGNNLPLIGVDHFLAHIYGAFLDGKVALTRDIDRYPLLALVVSGGHTALVSIAADGRAEIIGSTIDDAAGEALDKAAKLLRLGYPGGPIIEKAAQNGDPDRYAFPRSLIPAGGRPVAPENRYNFSFSGVKTSLLYHVEKLGGADAVTGQTLYDTIASYQQAIVDVLVMKTLAAVDAFQIRTMVLCGGVALNGLLRDTLAAKLPAGVTYIPCPRAYCGDNAAMVAAMAWRAWREKAFDGLNLGVYSRLRPISRAPFPDLPVSERSDAISGNRAAISNMG